MNDLKTQMDKDKPLDGSYRGIAFSRYKNSASYCAVGVELIVTDNVEVELKRAWITVDAGEIAFKEGIEASIPSLKAISPASTVIHARLSSTSTLSVTINSTPTAQ